VGAPGPIIVADGLGVRFVRNRRRNLKLREFFVRGGRRPPRVGELWAVGHNTFAVNPGDAVGVVGRNGTGKSTLLKLIAGVLIPDEGSVHTHDRVAPLLELSAGFATDLTGRENIQIVGALHGLSRAEVRERLPEILEFSEIGDFIDTPDRHYSTGMRVRLGFAVIAQLSHPILLVDEVLAVGDKDFRDKCYATIERMLGEGRTLVLVSHNEKDLRRFCNRGIYINSGVMHVDGSIEDALDAYNGLVRA
jgi:ABC-2 type transport system ATP-binding protein